MKKILLKSIMLGIALYLSFAANNVRSEGWENNNMQQAVAEFGTEDVSAAGGIGLGGNPNDEEGGGGQISAGPVGEGLWLLCGLGLLYGGYVFLRRRREDFS